MIGRLLSSLALAAALAGCSFNSQGILPPVGDGRPAADINKHPQPDTNPLLDSKPAKKDAKQRDTFAPPDVKLPADGQPPKPDAKQRDSQPLLDIKPPTDAPVLGWDISAVFTETHYNVYPVEIFSQKVNENQQVKVKLDGGKDSTYTAHKFTCKGHYTDKMKVQTWDIERKKVSKNAYNILVRGYSAEDCTRGQPVCAGKITLNPLSAWKIAKVQKCKIIKDSAGWGKVIPTHCTVDKAKGTVAWQSGSSCPKCCECPEGALVDIELHLSDLP